MLNTFTFVGKNAIPKDFFWSLDITIPIFVLFLFLPA